MSTPPRPSENSQAKEHTPLKPATSAPMVIVMTALDTTWRAFFPTIGGTFAGIGLDKLFNIAPIGLIICLVLGTALSIFLIARQLITVRK